MKNLSVLLFITILSILSSGLTLLPNNFKDFLIGFGFYFVFFVFMFAPVFNTNKKKIKK